MQRLASQLLCALLTRLHFFSAHKTAHILANKMI